MNSMTGEYRADRLVPTHPSNKNVLEQCLLWGWTIRAHASEWVELQHEDRADRIRVRPASHHSGNGGDVLSQVYKITCNGDAPAFWKREQPYHTRVRDGGGKQPVAMTDEQMEEYAARMRAQKPQSILDRLDKAAGLRDIPDPTERTPQLLIDTESNPIGLQVFRNNTRAGRSTYQPGVRPRNRTMEAEVLERLEQANLKTLTLDVLKALMPQYERGQLSNAMSRLADRGLVEQLKPRGNYRFTPPPKIAEPAPPTPAPPAVESAPEESPSSAPAPANSAHEDTVDALLDLMFPDGVKTRHLGALEEWRHRTLTLLKEIHES